MCTVFTNIFDNLAGIIVFVKLCSLYEEQHTLQCRNFFVVVDFKGVIPAKGESTAFLRAEY